MTIDHPSAFAALKRRNQESTTTYTTCASAIFTLILPTQSPIYFGFNIIFSPEKHSNINDTNEIIIGSWCISAGQVSFLLHRPNLGSQPTDTAMAAALRWNGRRHFERTTTCANSPSFRGHGHRSPRTGRCNHPHCAQGHETPARTPTTVQRRDCVANGCEERRVQWTELRHGLFQER